MNLTLAAVLVLMPAALLAPAPPARATTYYVRADGSDLNAGTADDAGGAWRTLQKAADAATSAGDTVRVRAGTYTGFRLMEAPGGTPLAPISFVADSGVTINARAAGASAGEGAINIENSAAQDGYYVVDGFTVNALGIRRGIRTALSNHNTIKNCTVYSADDTNIFCSLSDYAQVLNNVCYDAAGEHGIYVNGSNDYAIRGNTCYRNRWNGIHCNKLDYPRSANQANSRGVIDGNRVFDNGLAGMDLEGFRGGRVVNNLVYGNGKQGVVFQNGPQTSATRACGGNVVANNTIDTSAAGSASTGHCIQFARLDAGDAAAGGTATSNEDDTTVFNNVLVPRSRSACIGTAGTIPASFASDFNVLGADRMTRDYADPAIETKATWTTITGADTHSTVEANPANLFASYPGGAFTLKAGSAAIGVGRATFNGKSAPRVDVAGTRRGPVPDAGAYEFVGDRAGPLP